jgi:hypothetical protein
MAGKNLKGLRDSVVNYVNVIGQRTGQDIEPATRPAATPNYSPELLQPLPQNHYASQKKEGFKTS